MDNRLFRQKSIDKVTSPDQLNDYLKVTGVSTWVIIVALIIILGGAIVWTFAGKIVVTEPAAVVVENGEAIVYVNEDQSNKLAVGQTLNLDNDSFSITEVINEPVAAEGNKGIDEYVLHATGTDDGGWLIPLRADISGIDDGIYGAEIEVETISPVTFIIN